MNFSEDIILENHRVRLEPLSMNHLSDLLPISLKHPTLLKYSPSLFGNKELLQLNIQKAIIAREKEQQYPFAIFDKLNNHYVGSTSFGNFVLNDLRIEIGWTWINKESQGTGLNRLCKHLLLSYAFTNLKVERVEFKTDSRNSQSRRAIEKIGGVYEGILRSHILMLDGHRRDTVYYSILRKEWTSIEKELFDKSVSQDSQSK
jgi:N-acetyltransferase